MCVEGMCTFVWMARGPSWEVPYVCLLQWMARDHERYHMCACSNGWPGIMRGTICVPAPMDGQGSWEVPYVCLLQWDGQG